MQNLFKLDNRYYNLRVISIKRAGAILDGENAGRTLSGEMDRDIIGTYYTYTIDIARSSSDPDEYDAFYEAITDPSVECHDVEFPYGKNGTLAFKAYVANAEDNLAGLNTNGDYFWSGLSIQFTAMKPQRRPA